MVETPRLTLIPFSLDLMKVTMTEKARLEEILGVTIPDTWPEQDLAEALPIFIQNEEKEPGDSVWSGLVIHKTDQVLIGDMGFHGAPDEQGAVEVGYSIVPEYRNQGYATEMLKALIHWALQKPEIKIITAETDQDNIASITVLTKAGMHRSGSTDDSFTWEIRKEA